MGKRDRMFSVLEALEDAVYGAGDIIAAIVLAGADRRFSTIRRFVYQSRLSRSHLIIDRAERRRYYDLLYKMKRDGLVSAKNIRGKQVFALTKRGASKLFLLRKKTNFLSNVPFLPHYHKIQGNDFMIVSFDIPEKERAKRKWIRAALREMGFHMVQQSFWAGKVEVSRDFIDDLRRLQLLSYVEIFKATKVGSLMNDPDKKHSSTMVF